MQFETVFDVTQSGYRDWWLAAGGIIFIFLGGLLVCAPNLMQTVLPQGLQGRARRTFSWFLLVFAIVWTTVSFAATYGHYVSLKSAIVTGRYKTAEGLIQNFHPMPYTGHAMESFDAGGAHFEYSDYVITGAFNNTHP